MARFDVYRDPDGAGYLVDVQTDFLDYVDSRVVVPLLPTTDAPPIARRLNPVFDIGEVPHTMQPLMIAAVPATILRSQVANLADQSDQITDALDMLFQGF